LTTLNPHKISQSTSNSQVTIFTGTIKAPKKLVRWESSDSILIRRGLPQGVPGKWVLGVFWERGCYSSSTTGRCVWAISKSFGRKLLNDLLQTPGNFGNGWTPFIITVQVLIKTFKNNFHFRRRVFAVLTKWAVL